MSKDDAAREHLRRLRTANRMLAFAINDRAEDGDLWGDTIALCTIDAARRIACGARR